MQRRPRDCNISRTPESPDTSSTFDRLDGRLGLSAAAARAIRLAAVVLWWLTPVLFSRSIRALKSYLHIRIQTLRRQVLRQEIMTDRPTNRQSSTSNNTRLRYLVFLFIYHEIILALSQLLYIARIKHWLGNMTKLVANKKLFNVQHSSQPDPLH